jgi:hypothetical protein
MLVRRAYNAIQAATLRAMMPQGYCTANAATKASIALLCVEAFAGLMNGLN